MMKIGAQLFTVRDFCKNLDDFALTLRKVADIGYTSVQVSGTCAYEAAWLADQLKKNGLTCDLTHTNFDRLCAETEAVVAEHKLFGCTHIGLGSIPGMWPLEDKFQAYAPFVAQARPMVEKAHALGAKIMYHNHDIEYRFGGEKNMIERMEEDFPADAYGFTLDTYWAQFAGADPVKELERLSGRVDCIHLKDMEVLPDGTKRFAPVGGGVMDFDAILKAAEAAGTQFAFVEQDNCFGADPFDCLKKSYDFLISRGLR